MQATQHGDGFEICSCVCSFCLSINRRTTTVSQVSETLLNLMSFNVYSQGSQICWECIAHLKNYSEFCERAERAQEVLKEVNTQASLKGKSLSRLERKCAIQISIDSQNPDKNYISTSDETKLVQSMKKEMGEIHEESEVLEDFEAGTEYIDNKCETEYSDNCDDTMSAISLSLKSCDEFDGKHTNKLEGMDDSNMAVNDTPNRSNSKNTHPIANCSQNVDTDYEQYEKFIATEDEMRQYLKPICFKNKCKVCLREFTTLDNYLKHMEKFHSDCVGDHKCDVCDLWQPSEAALKLHRQQHYEFYRCLAEGCRFVHKFPPSLREHELSHKNKQKNVETYACHHCKKKFKNIYNVLRHIRLAHLDTMKCKYCSEEFRDRKSLDRHMKLLHVDKMVVCDVCGVKYATLTELGNHLLKHRNLNQKRYSCKICNKSFSCRFKEKIHQFVHNDKPRIRCHLCKTEFIKEEARTRHLVSKHGLTKEEVFEIPPLKPRRKNTATNCKFCGRVFQFPSKLEHHIMTQHSEDRPFKCHICGDGFKTRLIMDNHIRKHSDERPFKCDVCDKSYKFQGNLHTHKVLHTGERRFVCDICGSSFAFKGILKGHMIIHTGEKKFKCNVCGKKFPTNSCLKKHSKIHYT